MTPSQPLDAKQLRNLLSTLRISRSDLAHYIGISVDTLRKYTNGRRSIPLDAQSKIIEFAEARLTATRELMNRVHQLSV
jgi:DNA-binding transcriptional regulator YiaG